MSVECKLTVITTVLYTANHDGDEKEVFPWCSKADSFQFKAAKLMGRTRREEGVGWESKKTISFVMSINL